jgi:hypothetical protein
MASLVTLSLHETHRHCVGFLQGRARLGRVEVAQAMARGLQAA